MITPEPGVVGEWAELAAAGLGGIQTLSSIAFGNGISVAAGEQLLAPYDSRIWYSTDTLHWEHARLPELPPVDRIDQVVAGGPGFVALAVEFGTQTITHFYVSGDGREWTLAGSVAGQVKRVGTVGSKLVAFGFDSDAQPQEWISQDDAMTWSNPIDTSAATVADGVLALYDDGATWLWAVRSDEPGDDGDNAGPIELWRTVDGQRWVKVTDLPRSVSATEAWMTAGPAGWVVTSLRVTFPGASPGRGVREWSAWYSRDGVDWKRADSAPKHTDYILADESGFIAAGGDYGGCCASDSAYVQGTLWVSADGITWRQLPEAGWFGRVIEGLTRIGDMVVGVGVDWSDPEVGLGVVWTIDRSKLTATDI